MLPASNHHHLEIFSQFCYQQLLCDLLYHHRKDILLMNRKNHYPLRQSLELGWPSWLMILWILRSGMVLQSAFIKKSRRKDFFRQSRVSCFIAFLRAWRSPLLVWTSSRVSSPCPTNEFKWRCLVSLSSIITPRNLVCLTWGRDVLEMQC